MSHHIVPHVKFAKLNKQCDLASYQAEVDAGEMDLVSVVVDDVVHLDQGAFDHFCDNFMSGEFDWLRGRGGIRKVASELVGSGDVNDIESDVGYVRVCLLVVAPGRPSLYVDPQGYDYARYVGL